MKEREYEPGSLQIQMKKKLRDFTLDVSFTTQRNSGQGDGCVGILGASGCGKSMLLKSIAGIEEPDEGRICFNGRVLYDGKQRINLPPQKRRVGYLFQDYALFPNMTVKENISAGLKTGIYKKKKSLSSDEIKERVMGLVYRFHLKGLENQYPNHLSGGQKQRVALARILCYEPEVILLDEPFSAMDAHLKEQLRMEVMRVIKEYPGEAVLVTHDRDEAYQLCDRLILMDRGEIIGQGKTRDLFQNPGTVQAASITGCKNISEIRRINGHRVFALDWNVELEVEREVDDSVTHIGVRAHDLIPLSSADEISGKHENVVDLGKATVCEMPFEWYVTLENGLWWKFGKQAGEYAHVLTLPKAVRIPRDVVLLLKERE